MLSSRASSVPDSGIEPASLTSAALVRGFFTTSTTWEVHSEHFHPQLVFSTAEVSSLQI